MNPTIPSQPALNRSIALLKLEGALTNTIMTMPVITLFWQITLGMGWGQIVALQLVFMVVMIVANIPTGYLADRISPRKANMIGDIIAATGWLLYAISPNFPMAVIAEIVLGLGMATSSDADKSLLKWYSQRLSPSKGAAADVYDHHQGQQQLAVLAAGIPSMLIGGWLGLEGARLSMILSAFFTLIGATLVNFMVETGPLRSNGHAVLTGAWQFTKHAWLDMGGIINYALKTPRLAWSLVAQAVGSELTHSSIWLITPMLIATGAPASLIGTVWALQLALSFAGNLLPTLPPINRWYANARPHSKFRAGAILVFSAMLAFAINVNAATVWCFGLMAIARGWFGRVSNPIVMADTPESMRSTVGSLGSTMYRLLYIAPMLLLWQTADQSYEVVYLWQLVLFLPLSVAVYYGLNKTHRR